MHIRNIILHNVDVVARSHHEQLQVELFTERNQIASLVLVLCAKSLIYGNEAERRVESILGQAKLISDS